MHFVGTEDNRHVGQVYDDGSGKTRRRAFQDLDYCLAKACLYSQAVYLVGYVKLNFVVAVIRCDNVGLVDERPLPSGQPDQQVDAGDDRSHEDHEQQTTSDLRTGEAIVSEERQCIAKRSTARSTCRLRDICRRWGTQ